MTAPLVLDHDWSLVGSAAPSRVELNYGPIEEIVVRIGSETVVISTLTLLRALKGL